MTNEGNQAVQVSMQAPPRTLVHEASPAYVGVIVVAIGVFARLASRLAAASIDSAHPRIGARLLRDPFLTRHRFYSANPLTHRYSPDFARRALVFVQAIGSVHCPTLRLPNDGVQVGVMRPRRPRPLHGDMPMMILHILHCVSSPFEARVFWAWVPLRISACLHGVVHIATLVASEDHVVESHRQMATVLFLVHIFFDLVEAAGGKGDVDSPPSGVHIAPLVLPHQ